MYLNSGGYSDVQFDTMSLRAMAQDLSRLIPKMLERTGAQAVAVTGKSGLSLAFATLMLVDFPLIVVRKRGENSHGNPIEGTRYTDVHSYLILDDFVSSGATVRTIVASINEYNECGPMGASHPVECVGVLQYLRQSSGCSPLWYKDGEYSYDIPVYSMAELQS